MHFRLCTINTDDIQEDVALTETKPANEDAQSVKIVTRLSQIATPDNFLNLVRIEY